VWVINAEGKPEQRVVEVGDWHGDDWFITKGLQAGERIVVDGAIRVTPGGPLNIIAPPAPPATRRRQNRWLPARSKTAGKAHEHFPLLH
jgi:membrane fusion protein (multidrug efflux system)